MSLKIVHILFIALSVILSAGLGAWGVQSYLAEGSLRGLGFGVLFFVTGAVLLVYGIHFWKKMKEMRV
jgi:hypothetical protein